MLNAISQQARRWLSNLSNERRMSAAAKLERTADRLGVPEKDPGIDVVVESGVDWLMRAQDSSPSRDGGVSRSFSLNSGWATSYPETTGYIIPTLIDHAKRTGNMDVRNRAARMLDWLVSIQFPEGGFQGGKIDASPRVPVTFNTGQILIGLAAGTAEFGDVYRESMCRAADWLVNTQDADGCWRKHPTPYARPGEKTYETHVSWGLLEAARLAPDRSYGAAALANVRWALTQQTANGWLNQCCLSDPICPLTHTLGYALRGIVEAYRFSREEQYLEAARKTADGLLSALGRDGFLPGQLKYDWGAASSWVCLTGSVQIAHSWLLLYDYTGETRYRDAAFLVNRFVRRTIKVEGSPETRGAVKGSFPVDGDYGQYEYLNWACKFSIDANLAEKDVRVRESLGMPAS